MSDIPAFGIEPSVDSDQRLDALATTTAPADCAGKAAPPGATRRRPQAFLGGEPFEEPLMTQSRMHAAIALGGTMIIGAFVAFLPPVPPASAQSQAQRLCREQGVTPKSDTYEYCLSQTTRALEWGEPRLAWRFARVAAESREACLGYGLQPQTSGFRTCLDRETYARGLMVYADEPPKYGPQIADHP
jgi:hypothetical protein